MTPECVNLADFDMVEFIKANVRLSFRAFLSESASGVPRVTSCFPIAINDKDSRDLQAISSWAESKDPYGEKRYSYCKTLWDSRQPGEKFVPVCRGLNI